MEDHMKPTTIVLTIVLVVMLLGCKKEEASTAPEAPAANATEYFPLTMGHSWTYGTSGTLPDGSPDANSIHTLTASVLQTSQTVGGRPDATILTCTDEVGRKSNVIFAVDASRLWACLGQNFSLIGRLTGYIYFWPGVGWSSMLMVAMGSQERYLIEHYSFAGSMYLKRPPNPAIVAASIVGPDTLVLRGLQLGVTDLVLAPLGSPGDTMLVTIQVVNKLSAFGPPISQWMPLWELGGSNTVSELLKYDTTFSFIKSNGTVVSDHILFLATSQYLLSEDLSIGSGTLTADKYLVQISVTETIDTTGGAVHPVYSGLSGQATLYLWLARGAGIARSEISASGNKGYGVFVSMSGYAGPGGILIGSFVSPRLQYYYSGSPNPYEMFSINTAQPPSTGKYTLVLHSKNF
jgi:hypothetical protein